MKIYQDWEIQAIIDSLSEQAETRGEVLNSLRREKGLPPLATAKETTSAWMAVQVINQLQREITQLLQKHKVTGGHDRPVPPVEAQAESTVPKIVQAGDKIEDKRIRKQRKKTDGEAS